MKKRDFLNISFYSIEWLS